MADGICKIIPRMLPLLAAMLLAPLMIGTINRTKAFYAGRRGQPLLQSYFDLFKLLRKGSVYSRSASWVFRIAPAVSLAAIIFALAVFSISSMGSILSFTGDVLLAAYMLALARFATLLSALDTGSSFEGMGASREAMFAPFAELAFMILMLAAAVASGGFRALPMFSAPLSSDVRVLMAVSLFMLLLVENCRIPADDPNTHLELTMVHEVMVLDNSGPDLAFILYGAALKLWIFASLVSCVLLPPSTHGLLYGMALQIALVALVCICVGTLESVMARFRFDKVRRMLVFASVLSSLALLIAAGVSA